MKAHIFVILFYLCSIPSVLRPQSFNLYVETDSNLDFELTLNEFNKKDVLLSTKVKNGGDSIIVEFETSNRLRLLQFELFNETYGSISGGLPSLNTNLVISKNADEDIEVKKLFEPADQWYADIEKRMQVSYLAYKNGDHTQAASLIKALISDTTDARLDIISIFVFQLLYLDAVDESSILDIEKFYQEALNRNIQWGENILTLIASKREKDLNHQMLELSAFDVNGLEKDILALKHKPFMMLDFWATWCGPCIMSFPRLLEIHKKYQEHLDIVAISIDRDTKTWKNQVNKHSFPWTSLIDHQDFEDRIEHKLDIVRIPTYILIDKNEQIIYKGSNLEEIAEIIQRQK